MGWSQVELKQPDRDSRNGGTQSTSKPDDPKINDFKGYISEPTHLLIVNCSGSVAYKLCIYCMCIISTFISLINASKDLKTVCILLNIGCPFTIVQRNVC